MNKNASKILECSSKGDKRFSSLYAKMPDGFSIEHHYQVKLKGYNTIKDGKNKIGKLYDYKTQLKKYKALWIEYLRVNPNLFKYLIQKRKEGYVFNDTFAKPGAANQAITLMEIVDEWIAGEDFISYLDDYYED